jgi:hypothetical protein
MSTEQVVQEEERTEAIARRTIADFLGHVRRYSQFAHACRGFDECLRCRECGRDGARPPDVVTLFVGVLGRWWVNATGGGHAVDYVPVDRVLPVLRAYLAQSAELRRLRRELAALRGRSA